MTFHFHWRQFQNLGRDALRRVRGAALRRVRGAALRRVRGAALHRVRGADGADGNTPAISASKNGSHTCLYADGTLIATINDGETPTISAEKSLTTTTIYVNGQPQAQIEDGSSGISADDFDSISVISDIRAPDTAEMHPVETVDAETIEICDAAEVDVVVSEEYSTSTHQFKNTRKRITVIGEPDDATGQTTFTATSISSE